MHCAVYEYDEPLYACHLFLLKICKTFSIKPLSTLVTNMPHILTHMKMKDNESQNLCRHRRHTRVHLKDSKHRVIKKGKSFFTALFYICQLSCIFALVSFSFLMSCSFDTTCVFGGRHEMVYT